GACRRCSGLPPPRSAAARGPGPFRMPWPSPPALPGLSFPEQRSSDRWPAAAEPATLLPMRPRLLLALALATAPGLAQPEGGVITLGVGQQRIFQPGDVARVAIGEPEVADVKQVGTGGELLLTGVGEGRTSLLVWRRGGGRLAYTVVVRRQDPKE